MPAVNKRNNRALSALAERLTSLEERDIDQLYGLEPVYEPGKGLPGLLPDEFVAVQCPYCGERFETHVDVTAGERTYIEDCEVCCRPCELAIELEENGALHAVKIQRVD